MDATRRGFFGRIAGAVAAAWRQAPPSGQIRYISYATSPTADELIARQHPMERFISPVNANTIGDDRYGLGERRIEKVGD